MYAIRSYYAFFEPLGMNAFGEQVEAGQSQEVEESVPGPILCPVFRGRAPFLAAMAVITSYSIHYTKLYEALVAEFL